MAACTSVQKRMPLDQVFLATTSLVDSNPARTGVLLFYEELDEIPPEVAKIVSLIENQTAPAYLAFAE